MKASKIIWGVLIIAAAVVLILQGAGVLGDFSSVVGELSVWRIVLGICLMAFIIKDIVKLKIDRIFVPLGFIFMLFESNIAYLLGIKGDMINNWIVFGCSLLLSIGVGLIMPKRRKKFKFAKNVKVSNGHVRVNIDDGDTIEVEADEVEDVEDVDVDEDKDDDDDDGDFASATSRYFDGATFTRGSVQVKMGAAEISFENADKYKGGGVLRVDCKMGAISVNVPREWRVECDVDTAFGAVNNEHKNFDPEAPTLTIEGKCSFGAINIE